MIERDEQTLSAGFEQTDLGLTAHHRNRTRDTGPIEEAREEPGRGEVAMLFVSHADI